MNYKVVIKSQNLHCTFQRFINSIRFTYVFRSDGKLSQESRRDLHTAFNHQRLLVRVMKHNLTVLQTTTRQSQIAYSPWRTVHDVYFELLSDLYRRAIFGLTPRSSCCALATQEYTSRAIGPLCSNVTSSTKPDVLHNVSQRYQRKTTATGNVHKNQVKFGSACAFWPTVLSVEPMVQHDVCLSSVVCLSVCLSVCL